MIKKEGIFTFVIVKAEKPKVERGKPREKHPTRWKGAVIGMKKLGVGDYIIAANEIPEGKLYQTVANIKYRVSQHLGRALPRRTFEFKAIPETDGKTGYQVIIRRIV